MCLVQVTAHWLMVLVCVTMLLASVARLVRFLAALVMAQIVLAMVFAMQPWLNATASPAGAELAATCQIAQVHRIVLLVASAIPMQWVAQLVKTAVWAGWVLIATRLACMVLKSLWILVCARVILVGLDKAVIWSVACMALLLMVLAAATL